MRAGTLPTSLFRVVSLATGPTFRVRFLLGSLALLGIFLFLFLQFLAVLDHVALFLAIISFQVMSDVCPVERRVLGLVAEEVIDAIGKSSDSSRALSSYSLSRWATIPS